MLVINTSKPIFSAMLGTLPIAAEISEGLFPEFIFLLVDLLRVDNLEFRSELHFRIHWLGKFVNFPD